MCTNFITLGCLTLLGSAVAAASPPKLAPQLSREALVTWVERLRRTWPDPRNRPKPTGERLQIVGFGIEATLRLPVGVAYLANGSLLLGPVNTATVADQATLGHLETALLEPGSTRVALGPGVISHDG